MDIDNLFKVPKLPLGNKRKLPELPTTEILKRMKMDISASDTSRDDSSTEPWKNGKGKARVETVEDEDDLGKDLNFAPGGDADYFAEEDDEGRFFGGGLTSEQKEILNIFESAAGEGVQEDSEELSITVVRRILLRFQRAVNKNQDLRSKYPDDPTKFIDSEADLDAAIKALLPLAQAPVLAYSELVHSGTVKSLVGLLAHENADIVIDVVEVVHELTDEDVGNENEDEDEDAEQTAEGALKTLIEELLKCSILELLVDNLPRLNEGEESDRQGVFHILGIFENTLGFNPKLSTKLVEETSVLTWLLQRIQSKIHDENRGYAAELLSILLQDNQKNRQEFGKQDGVEGILRTLSQYRRRNPADADETEFMENLFDTLCSALSESTVKALFLAAEGPDLMILMMKEKFESKQLSIKVLDYAMSGVAGSAICTSFVDAYGLKTLFSALMGKGAKKQKSTANLPPSEDTTHILGIISSLLSNIASDSPARIRLLAKFVESNYEKVDRLLEIRDGARLRLKATEASIEKEKQEVADNDDVSESEATWYLRRLDGGLFTLQAVDYILAWIMMEDDGIRTHCLQMLRRTNQHMKDIIQTLRVFHENVDDPPAPSVEDISDHSLSQKDILENLIGALDTYDTE